MWQNGVMTPLPTLGGTHGFAAGTNNRGQIVGWAENTVHDSKCEPPQVLQFRPVVWGPDDRIRELPLLPGDTSGAATAINDRGQVVGISGICDQAVGRFTARHAVLWDDGKVIDIGNLGGVAWHTPNAINLRGDIVGFANFSEADGGNLRPHAFLWTESDGIEDLGTLPAPLDDNSDAWGHQQAAPGGRQLLRRRRQLPRLPVAGRRDDGPQRAGRLRRRPHRRLRHRRSAAASPARRSTTKRARSSPSWRRRAANRESVASRRPRKGCGEGGTAALPTPIGSAPCVDAHRYWGVSERENCVSPAVFTIPAVSRPSRSSCSVPKLKKRFASSQS